MKSWAELRECRLERYVLFDFFFNSSFCFSQPFGVLQGGNCRLAERALVALESGICGGGGGAPTLLGQSSSLSLCELPPSSCDCG